MTVPIMLAFTIAFAAMTVIGYLTVDLLLSSERFSRRLMWALAAPVGAGICSLVLFLFRRPMFTVEAMLLITLSSIFVWRHGVPRPRLSALTRPRVSVLGLLLAVALMWVVTESLQRMERIPHGGWDGFAIWNSHARYLYRMGQSWQDHLQNTFHGDYPLLLPSMVVRLWRYAGEGAPELGGLFGVLFPFCGIFLLGAVLAELRGVRAGLLMASVLLTTPVYLYQSTHQEADVPLSVFFLGTVALLCLYFEREEKDRGLLVLAGFMAGCAAWTKNEGLLFILAVVVVLLLPVFWKPHVTVRRLGLISAGLLLPLAVHVFFKVAIAPPNDLTGNRNYAELAQKALTVDRHAIVFGNILEKSWEFGGSGIHPAIPIVAFFSLAGIDRRALRRPAWRAGAAILGFVLAGYYWVYVLTPHQDLVWHLNSSLSRLLVQLWPSVILLAGLATRQRQIEKAAPTSSGSAGPIP
jgi:hypothetical protein